MAALGVGGGPRLVFFFVADTSDFTAGVTQVQDGLKKVSRTVGATTQSWHALFSMMQQIGSLGRQILGLYTMWTVWNIRLIQYQNQLREATQRRDKALAEVIRKDSQWGLVTERVANILQDYYKTQMTVIGSFDDVRRATGDAIIAIGRFGPQSEEAKEQTLAWHSAIMKWAEEARRMDVPVEDIMEVVNRLGDAIEKRQIPDWEELADTLGWSTDQFGPLGSAGLEAGNLIAKGADSTQKALENTRTFFEDITKEQENWHQRLIDAKEDMKATDDKITATLNEQKALWVMTGFEVLGFAGQIANIAMMWKVAAPAMAAIASKLGLIKAGALSATAGLAGTAAAVTGVAAAGAGFAAVLLWNKSFKDFAATATSGTMTFKEFYQGIQDTGDILGFSNIRIQDAVRTYRALGWNATETARSLANAGWNVKWVGNTLIQMGFSAEQIQKAMEDLGYSFYKVTDITEQAMTPLEAYEEEMSKLTKPSPIPDVVEWTEKQAAGLQILRGELANTSAQIRGYGDTLAGTAEGTVAQQEAIERLGAAVEQTVQPKDFGAVFSSFREEAAEGGSAAGKAYWENFQSLTSQAETAVTSAFAPVADLKAEAAAATSAAMTTETSALENTIGGYQQVIAEVKNYIDILSELQNISILQHQTEELNTFEQALNKIKDVGPIFETLKEKAGEEGATAGKTYQQSLEALISAPETARFLAAQKIPVETAGVGGIAAPTGIAIAGGRAGVTEERLAPREAEINYNFGDIHIHVQQFMREMDIRDAALKFRRYIQMETARTR